MEPDNCFSDLLAPPSPAPEAPAKELRGPCPHVGGWKRPDGSCIHCTPIRTEAPEGPAAASDALPPTEEAWAPQKPAARPADAGMVRLGNAIEPDLLESLRRASDPIMTAALKKLAAKGRVHLCVRCCHNEEETRRHAPEWTPYEARSWIGANGRRYWGAFCVYCEKIEREEQVARLRKAAAPE